MIDTLSRAWVIASSTEPVDKGGLVLRSFKNAPLVCKKQKKAMVRTCGITTKSLPHVTLVHLCYIYCFVTTCKAF